MESTKMTSYERVYNALFITTTCKEVWASALKTMDEVKIGRVEWRCQTSEDSAKAIPQFHFTNETVWGGESISTSEVNARTLLTEEMARKVIDIHFGSEKDVKTFNCKTDIVRCGGTVSRKNRYDEREKQYQSDFHDFLLDKFRAEAHDALKVTTKRLRKECSEMTETAAFKQARREALIGFCKNTLTRALLPWHEMEQSVLEEAWDQFICTAIMRN